MTAGKDEVIGLLGATWNTAERWNDEECTAPRRLKAGYSVAA